MNLLNNFIQRQGELILNKPTFAYALVFLFAGLPFLTWISVSIMALITLRKGVHDGAKMLAIGLLGLLVAILLSSKPNLTQLTYMLLTYVPAFIGAWLLRVTGKWDASTTVLILFASIVVVYFHFFPPAILLAEYKILVSLIQEYEKEGMQLKSWLSNKDQVVAYLLGLKATLFLISTFGSLILARAFQAKLFYPAGFKLEMLGLKSKSFMVVPLGFILLGLYYNTPLSLSLAPIWALYFAACGLSTLICMFASHRALVVFLLLLAALIFLPIFMLPLVISVGTLDSLFDFRRHYKDKSGANSSKGV